jgi:hypothetical protein
MKYQITKGQGGREGRQSKKEEGRRKKEEGRRKKELFLLFYIRAHFLLRKKPGFAGLRFAPATAPPCLLAPAGRPPYTPFRGRSSGKAGAGKLSSCPLDHYPLLIVTTNFLKVKLPAKISRGLTVY